MAKKTILITGSTDGIGRATARFLAEQGHRILIHGRDRAKGRAALEEVEAAAVPEQPALFIADLSVQDRIRDLAEEVAGACDRLDVLINNAGVFMPERRVAPGGIEMTFAVNFLAGLLLTHSLLPLLAKSAPARVVNVASIAHRSVRTVDWGNIPGFEDYDGYDAYATSKLGVVACTARLARILDGMGVTANSLHPGVIDTKLLRAYTGGRDGGAPPEKGAAVEAHLATSPDAGEVSGRYFEATRWTRPSPLALDADVQERFWEMGLDLVGVDRW